MKHILRTIALFSALALCATNSVALSPVGDGYALVAPSVVGVAGDTLAWTDSATFGQSGYKVEVFVSGKWKLLLRGTDPAQRSFVVPKAYADAKFRVYAYTDGLGNGRSTESTRAPTQVIAAPTQVIAAPTQVIAKFSAPQNLGNPFLGKRNVYARNVWDMQSYGGKIYLGHGDSARNSGRTPIISLDPHSGQFTNEFTTTSEQVDEFFPIGSELYTLDHDPVGANNGNLYCTDGGDWCIKENISGAVHEYSLVEHSGALFVGGSSGTNGSSVWRNSGGNNWHGTLTGEMELDESYKKLLPSNFKLWGTRAFLLLEVKGKLYAVRQGWLSGDLEGKPGFFRFDETRGQFEQSPVSGATLSGGLNIGNLFEVRYKRLVKLDDGSVLTLLVKSINDHQWDPVSLMHVSAIAPGGVAALALPGNAKPYDILRRGNLVYVCAFDASHGQNVVFSLPASNVGANPTETLRFDAPTFARSFEEAGGNFYFGLGCDVSPTPAQTGEIWKVAVGN